MHLNCLRSLPAALFTTNFTFEVLAHPRRASQLDAVTMTTFDDLPDATESPPGSHIVHKETRDELRHLVNEAMRHSQAKAATTQAMEQAERASE